MSNRFSEFVDRFGESAGDEILERICDAHWNGAGEGVVFSDIYQHDSCNHTLSGSIRHAGKTFYFIIHNGNHNGTEVDQFGSVDDVGEYIPPPPSRFMFIPKLGNRTKAKIAVFRIWTKKSWFKEKLEAYHYDRHFQPGQFIEQHYRQWANERGLEIVPQGESNGL